MIKDISELKNKKTIIDLTGPNGNAFVLLGLARKYSKKLGKDWEKIEEKMTSDDYDNLIKIFDENFGEFVELYR